MDWWWIAMGVVVAAGLALAPSYHQRRRRRRRLDMIRARVEASLSELLKQPDGAQPSEVVAPPTFDFAPSAPNVVRPRRTLMFGALYPDISVGPRRAA